MALCGHIFYICRVNIEEESIMKNEARKLKKEKIDKYIRKQKENKKLKRDFREDEDK